MIRIKHYNGADTAHRKVEITHFPEVDRMDFLFKLLTTFRQQNDLETEIRWTSHFSMELNTPKDVPYGVRSYIRRRPSVHLSVPAISIRRMSQSESDDMDWEDLIQLSRPQSEVALVELIEEYIAQGELD
jgi:hypothetical protein